MVAAARAAAAAAAATTKISASGRAAAAEQHKSRCWIFGRRGKGSNCRLLHQWMAMRSGMGG
eukprot:5340320-Pleurochrysis_carterae.AAC.1